MRDPEWRRIAGFRVVMSWPQSSYTTPPARTPVNVRARVAGLAGVLLVLAGAAAIGVAAGAQQHAPQPASAAAGVIGGPGGGAHLRRSLPVAVDIPAIGVRSRLLRLGINPNGTIQVPSLHSPVDEAAWYKYSATPGQLGASVIVGHVDTYRGPAVFFRLGGLHPGNRVYVVLADGITAVFRVTGVRQYAKSRFPAKIIYGRARDAALRLITCGGSFDYTTLSYRSSTVVFASLVSARRAD